jgi:signal transduction histidine kinase
LTGKDLFSFALTLRGRLLVLICLATLPAMLFTFYTAQQERTAAVKRSLADARHTLDLLSREHLYQLTGAKTLLRWLADRMSKEKIDERDNGTLVTDSKFLAALLCGYPQLANIAVLSPSGDVISSGYPLSGPINMARYGAIEQALNSNQIETGVYAIGPIVKRPLLHLAKSVRDQNGSVRSVVFVAIDLSWLKQLTEKIQMPPGHILMIVDRDGRILSSSKHEDNRYQPGAHVVELRQRTSTRQTPFVTTHMQDMPGVEIVTAVPYDRIYAQANGIFFRELATLSLLTLCTVVSVVLLEELALLRYLRSLSTAAKRFGEGDYSARASIPQEHGELAKVASVFNTMALTLARRHQEQIEAKNQLDRLSRHVQIAREDEAQRIARDLHDEVGQVLTSIKLDLASIQRKFKQASLKDDDVRQIMSKIDNLVHFVRTIASDLRPPVLDKMGLVAAIELLARNLEKQVELVVDVDADKLEFEPDWLVSINVYRIVQETLTNIARHSKATEVHLQLRRLDEQLVVTVRDNGLGLAVKDKQKESLGIIGMAERARLVQGSFSIDSDVNGGTLITVKVPYQVEKIQCVSC